MILPDSLNYYTYHSSTQIDHHLKKASGTSGTSQHAYIIEKDKNIVPAYILVLSMYH